MSGFGSGSVRQGNDLYVGSFAFSGSSSIGSGAKIHLKTWAECETYGEKAGFIIGRPIQYLAVNGCKLLNSAVTTSCDCYERVANFASDYIKPIFVNDCTRRAISWTSENILTPGSEAVSNFAQLIFKTFLWDSILVPFGTRAGDLISEGCSQVCKCYERVSELASDYIKPIFVNEYTTGLLDWVWQGAEALGNLCSEGCKCCERVSEFASTYIKPMG